MARPDTNYLTAPELAQVSKLVAHLNESHRTPVNPLAAEVQLYDSNGENAGIINTNEEGTFVYYPSWAVGS